MSERTRLTSVETVHEEGSWLFTARDRYGEPEEVVVVPCEDGVEAWLNRCTHEAQRLDRGTGAPIRDGQIICPRHGSMFDACSGYCDNGDAADTTLVSVELAVEGGDVYLADRGYEFDHEGAIEDGAGTDGDDEPDSTSHIGF
ncbi:Rieske (2Fe-2S) protein [Halorussus marinus]|uniref:Rieske (2Fe-2S) protein n=1 Tax=Halorussus marinus TaxID=2505976 RepID=UPI001092AB5D|nr:Rieske (2Fe-2S) protein [Halorussus marinus]